MADRDFAVHVAEVVVPSIDRMNAELRLKIQHSLHQFDGKTDPQQELQRLLTAALDGGLRDAGPFAGGINLRGDDAHPHVGKAVETAVLAAIYVEVQERMGKGPHPSNEQIIEDRQAAGAPLDAWRVTEASADLRGLQDGADSNLLMVLNGGGVSQIASNSIMRNLSRNARQCAEAALGVGGRKPS